MYEIEFSKKAAKFYQKADTVTVRRLNTSLDRLAEDPFHQTNVKPLAAELQGSYRLRVGNIRIVYSVDDAAQIVYIEVMGFRGDIYKK